MDIIEYVENLDTKFNNIKKDYKYIYDNIHNYLNDGKVSYNQLMDFEVSLEDLSIQLNSLVFLFKQIQIESVVLLFNQRKTNDTNNTNVTNNINKETKVDYIIEKTIFQFMPLLFIYFMVFDKESILYAKDFIENKYDTKSYDTKSYDTKSYDTKSYDPTNKHTDFHYVIEPIDD